MRELPEQPRLQIPPPRLRHWRRPLRPPRLPPRLVQLAERGREARPELAPLRDEAGDPELAQEIDVPLARTGAHRDDRALVGEVRSAQHHAELDPVHLRHVEIEQHHVRRPLAHGDERPLRVRHDDDRRLRHRPLRVHPEELPERGVVIDHEDGELPLRHEERGGRLERFLHRAQPEDDRLHARRPIERVLREHLAHEAGEAGGRVGAERAQVGRLDVEVLLQDLDRRLPLERHVAGEELVSGDPERVDVRVERLARVRLALERLGRHVLRRAAEDGGAGVLGAEEPEVHQHDPPVRREHDVPRLHVAVRDPGPVHRRERVGDRDEDVERLAQVERRGVAPPLLEERLEVHAVEKLHHQEGDPAVRPRAVHVDHPGMAHGRERLRLLVEERLVDRRPARLDGDATTEREVVRAVDAPHPPFAEDAPNLVRAGDGLAELEELRVVSHVKGSVAGVGPGRGDRG